MNRFIRNFQFRGLNTMIPWSKQSNIIQKQIIQAKGPFLYTKKERILDFTSGAMVVNLGHNNKYIQKAFEDHSNSGIAYTPSNFSTEQREKLSSRLLNEANMEKGKVLFCNAGADANEMAAFITKEYHFYNSLNTDKHRIVSFIKSFHGGSTIGASILSGDPRRTQKDKYYTLPLEPILPNPSMEDNGLESLNTIDKILDKESISSVLLEGSSGSAGCILYPHKYLEKLKIKCDKNNILIICDEVMSGFGRTGEFFAHSIHNIKPDIITCAKAITCGYIPLGAVIINEKVSSVFDENPVMCGLTYSGHPLSCLVANHCMDLYLENDKEVIKNVNKKTYIMEEKCKQITSKYSFINSYRNNGLLGCFDMSLEEDNLLLLSKLLLDNGIYCMRIRNNIFTAPPLTIRNSQLNDGLKQIDTIFKHYESLL